MGLEPDPPCSSDILNLASELGMAPSTSLWRAKNPTTQPARASAECPSGKRSDLALRRDSSADAAAAADPTEYAADSSEQF